MHTAGGADESVAAPLAKPAAALRERRRQVARCTKPGVDLTVSLTIGYGTALTIASDSRSGPVALPHPGQLLPPTDAGWRLTRACGGGQLRGPQQHLTPALRRLPDSVLDGQEVLVTTGVYTDHHQHTRLVWSRFTLEPPGPRSEAVPGVLRHLLRDHMPLGP